MSKIRNKFSVTLAALTGRELRRRSLFTVLGVRILIVAVTAGLVAPLTFAAESNVTAAAGSDPGRPEEAAQCRQNLLRIHTAIRAYRTDKKQLPNWLSDLVPQYLNDANALTCPVTRRTGRVNNFGLVDPSLPTSYLYEFCNAPVPSSIGGGSKHTMREWKEKQVELVGDGVPLVRCHLHLPQISISLGGTLFESSDAWEKLYTNRVSADSLSPGRIFPGETRASAPVAPAAQAPAIIRIPARDPQALSSLVDLTDYYNAGLNEGWHHVAGSQTVDSDLSWLPKGIQRFAGTEFDVRGIIQLGGLLLNTQRFPQSVKGIRVNRKCSTLSFLHSTGWSVPDGTRIGHYRVVYSGGEEREIPLVYGLDVRDWYLGNNAVAGPDPKNSVVAWMGKSPATQAQGITLRLFKTSWENPLGNLRVETIDYVSAMTNCAPFLIAITAE